MEKMIEEALKTSSVIAVVGLSNKTDRPSYQVAKYLQEKGYKIVPVNPTVSEVLGQRSYPDHESVPEKVDLVDVFRRSEKVLPIAEQAVKIYPAYFWMQEDVENEDAKKLLEANNIAVIMNRCTKKEHLRFIEKL